MQNLLNFFRSLSPIKSFFHYIFQRIFGEYFHSNFEYNPLEQRFSFPEYLYMSSSKFNENLLKTFYFGLKQGFLYKLSVKIPWTNLLTQSIEVLMDEVVMILEKKEPSSLEKQNKVQCNEEISDKNNVFKKIVKKIMQNLKVKIKKITIILLDEEKKNQPTAGFFQFNNLDFFLDGENLFKLKIFSIKMGLIEDKNIIEYDKIFELSQKALGFSSPIEISYDKEKCTFGLSLDSFIFQLTASSISFIFKLLSPINASTFLTSSQKKHFDESPLLNSFIPEKFSLKEEAQLMNSMDGFSPKTSIIDYSRRSDPLASIIDDFFHSFERSFEKKEKSAFKFAEFEENNKENEEFCEEDIKVLECVVKKQEKNDEEEIYRCFVKIENFSFYFLEEEQMKYDDFSGFSLIVKRIRLELHEGGVSIIEKMSFYDNLKVFNEESKNNSQDESFYSLDSKNHELDENHFCRMALFRTDPKFYEKKSEETNFFTLKTKKINENFRKTHYFLEKKRFSQPKNIKSSKKHAISLKITQDQFKFHFSPIILNFNKKSIEKFLLFLKNIDFGETNIENSTKSHSKTKKNPISIKISLIKTNYFVDKYEKNLCYCNLEENTNNILVFESEKIIFLMENINKKHLKIAFSEIFLLKHEKNEFFISKIASFDEMNLDMKLPKKDFFSKITKIPHNFNERKEIYEEYIKEKKVFCVIFSLISFKFFVNLNNLDYFLEIYQHFHSFLPFIQEKFLSSSELDSEEGRSSFLSNISQVSQENRNRNIYFDLKIEDLTGHFFEFQDDVESNSQNFLHNKFTEKLKKEALFIEFHQFRMISFDIFVNSSALETSSQGIKISTPEFTEEIEFKCFEIENVNFPCIFCQKQRSCTQNKEKNSFLDFSNENCFFFSFFLEKITFKTQKTIENSSNSEENSQLIEENYTFCKKITIKISFSDILLRPLLMLEFLRMKMEFLQILYEKYFKFDKNSNKNPNFCEENTDQIYFEINLNEISFDIFPVIFCEKEKKMSFLESRSLISIKNLNCKLNESGSIEELFFDEIKGFFNYFASKSSVSKETLMSFIYFNDFHRFLREYYETSLEFFGFKPIFLVKNIDFLNGKKIKIDEIYMELCQDSPFYLKKHFQSVLQNIQKVFYPEGKEIEINKTENIHSSSVYEQMNESIENTLESSKAFVLKIQIFVNYLVVFLYDGVDFPLTNEISSFPINAISEISLNNNKILEKYFHYTKKAKFPLLCQNRNTRNYSKYCRFKFKEFEFGEAVCSQNPGLGSEFTFSLKELKIHDLLNKEKKKIFHRENKNLPFFQISCQVSLEGLLTKCLMHFNNIILSLNPHILEFLNEFLICSSENPKEKAINSEKNSYKIQKFEIEIFKLNINYEPSYQNLAYIIENPLYLVNIGPIRDLEIRFKKICLEKWDFDEIWQYCIDIWSYDIKTNQKAEIIKKLPYIYNLLQFFDKIMKFLNSWKRLVRK